MGVDVKLNDGDWFVDGVEFNGSLDSHKIDLVYGKVPQKAESQSCFGTLRVLIEGGAL
ncbi:hypothetical protein VCJ_001044 [Vibrio metoecus]|nr:hypothetical protein VCJ_001044 [Vibrio metoecus]